MATKREVLERLQEGGNIYRFFASRVALKPTKKKYQAMALCPFHADHHPSLSINTQRGVFYCFGCKARGDIFAFRMLLEKIGFSECLKAFARELGLTDEGAAT